MYSNSVFFVHFLHHGVSVLALSIHLEVGLCLLLLFTCILFSRDELGGLALVLGLIGLSLLLYLVLLSLGMWSGTGAWSAGVLILFLGKVGWELLFVEGLECVLGGIFVGSVGETSC